MKVNLVIAARDFRLREDNDFDILGVFTEALPKALPGLLPLLYLIVFCEAQATEFDQEKFIEIFLLDADGETLQLWYDIYMVPQPPRKGERSFFAPIFTLRDVPFRKPGNYAFSINVDSDYKNSLPFYVHEPTEVEEGEE